MVQQYIVLGIIALAIAYTVYSVSKSLFSKSNTSACGGCGSCEFKQQAKKNMARKQKEQAQQLKANELTLVR